MRDLSKTEIKVNHSAKLAIPDAEQIKKLVSLLQNPENLKFVDKFPDWPHAKDLEQKIFKWLELAKAGEFLFFIILVEDKIAGTCRIIDINYSDEKAELGYILLPQFTKRGIATNCVNAMLGFCFDKLNLNRVELCISDDNSESIKLAQRLKFKHEGTLRDEYKYKYSKPGEFSTTQIWSMLKSEYNS
jgi:RimJ/RimL family protein N-acetyltransferase